MRRNPEGPDRKAKDGKALNRLMSRRLENLSDTVNDLFQKAVQNEKTLRRFQQFELKLLDLSCFDDLLDMLLRNSLDHFQLDCVELWLYDPQSTLKSLLPDEYLLCPDLKLFKQPKEMELLYGRCPEVRLLSTAEGGNLSVFEGSQMRSAALLPLLRQGILVGSLHFGAKGHQRFTADKSTEFITHLASVVAVCLENVVNHERLRRLSMYDMLTQVKNRRAFHQALEKEISRASRNGDPLSMLFVDLDHFKQINDSHGHPMGDKVLKVIAQYINEMLRKTDHVCRYGGEEFALILPNCGQQRAMEIAERIREQISQLSIDDDTSDDAEQRELSPIHVTLSIGVSCWLPMDELDAKGEALIARELVARSDQGVYQSKAAGRNCVHYIAMDSVYSGDYSCDL